MKNNTAVFIYIGNNKKLSKFIQEGCFEKQVFWKSGVKSIQDFGYTEESLCFRFENHPSLTVGDKDYFSKKKQIPEISIPEFLDIINNFKLPPAPIKLNNDYTAEITADGNVKVGCQIIKAAPILELAEAIKKFQKENI